MLLLTFDIQSDISLQGVSVIWMRYRAGEVFPVVKMLWNECKCYSLYTRPVLILLGLLRACALNAITLKLHRGGLAGIHIVHRTRDGGLVACFKDIGH